jgi:hypothetical protein
MFSLITAETGILNYLLYGTRNSFYVIKCCQNIITLTWPCSCDFGLLEEVASGVDDGVVDLNETPEYDLGFKFGPVYVGVLLLLVANPDPLAVVVVACLGDR